MKSRFTKTIQLVLLLVLPNLAILPFSSAQAIGAAQQKHAQNEFYAVLVDTVSKNPVQFARIILAPQKKGKSECVINTSLTGVSSERGEVRIPNVRPGEYVIFYNLSAVIKPELKGKVVNYDPETSKQQERFSNLGAISSSLGQLMSPKGEIGINKQGRLVLNGYIYSVDFDLAMISSEGELRTVRVPIPEGSPVRIEISTDIKGKRPIQPSEQTRGK